MNCSPVFPIKRRSTKSSSTGGALVTAAMVVFTLASCGTSGSDSTTTSETAAVVSSAEAATPGDAANVTAGVKAAKWSDNVTITYADTTFTFASNGLPSHELPDQSSFPTVNRPTRT